VTVDMGEPRFAPGEIPMTIEAPDAHDYPLDIDGERVVLTALSTGTTHSVIFVEALPPDDLFFRLSPRIENHPNFPERTSVLWTEVLDKSRVRIRIWERGAGETLGCGTGACAAAIAAQIHGFVEKRVVVVSKGGELIIEWSEGAPIRMTGPAEYVFRAVYPLNG